MQVTLPSRFDHKPQTTIVARIVPAFGSREFVTLTGGPGNASAEGGRRTWIVGVM